MVAEAGRISSPELTGVGPKNKQIALPGGQNAISPKSTVSLAHSSFSLEMEVEKYISSPHIWEMPSMGSELIKALEVGESFNSPSMDNFSNSKIIYVINFL